MAKFSRKKDEPRKAHISYQRQSAYHYSAKRSNADRLFDRGLSTEDTAVQTPARFTPVQKIVIGVCSIGLIYSCFLIRSASVDFAGSQARLNQEPAYRMAANELLGKSVMNYAKLTFNHEKYRSELQSKFPEISRVEVSTPFYALKPQVTLIMAQPAVLFSTEHDQYILDEQGRALFNTKELDTGFDTSALPVVQDQTTFRARKGKPALTRSQIAYIHELAVQADAKGLVIESMILRSGGGELDVRYERASYYVKYNLFENPRLSFGTFYAARLSLEEQNVKPAEYIDVRIPERAYIK